MFVYDLDSRKLNYDQFEDLESSESSENGQRESENKIFDLRTVLKFSQEFSPSIK